MSGHYAKYCPNKDKCVICAGSHKVTECELKNKENPTKKCANCDGNHTANYGGCMKMQQEMKIQHVRAYNNLSYRDATIAVKKSEEVVRSGII
jgi:hypothetical protein